MQSHVHPQQGVPRIKHLSFRPITEDAVSAYTSAVMHEALELFTTKT